MKTHTSWCKRFAGLVLSAGLLVVTAQTDADKRENSAGNRCDGAMRKRRRRHARDHNGLAVETLAAMIAHSHIVVAQPANPASRFPAGFDEVDISILDWIAAEGRRVGRSFVRM
jgi:hypothetical protein